MSRSIDSSLTAAALLADSGAAVPDFVSTFAHAPNQQVIFGPGIAADLGTLTKNLPVRRVLVVSDPGIAAAGHLGRVLGILESAGIQAQSFTDVCENPTTETVAKCVAAAREAQAEAFIGLGGGSSMDAAKGANFILTNGGQMKDYWGVGKATQPMLPFIAIPTTAGTGSECQSFALISDATTHAKMACGDKKAAARIALLDPEFSMTQPGLVTRHTGIDALTHALESSVSTKATETSRAYSRAAFALLAKGLPRVLDDSQNLLARSQMLLGAALAGVAIENSMLGAAHSCANPLTAAFDVVHGEAVGVMMPAVLRYNLQEPTAAAEYAALAGVIGLKPAELPDWFAQLLETTGLPTCLRKLGIAEKDLAALSAHAATQWTANFNPRRVTEADLLEIYRAAL